MNILIIYATNSGSTFLTSKIIKEGLVKAGNTVDLVKAALADVSKLKDYDLVLFGSPSWLVNGKEGQPHETMLEFIEKLRALDPQIISSRSYALFGCGDSTYLNLCGAVDVLDGILNELKVKQLVKPLKIDSFYFDLEKNKAQAKSWAENLASSLPVSRIV